MKKLYLIFPVLSLLFLLISNKSISQPVWQNVNLGTYENLNSVSFPDIYTGFIAGNNGKFFKTTNGGVNWIQILLPSAGNNFYVYFYSTDFGFVSSQAGLYKTTNGGGNWVLISLPSVYAVTSIHFSTPSTGWLGNFYGQIMKTTNGGDNWTIMNTMPGYNSKVFFINDFTGWAVDTYGYVFRTTNGGTNFASLRISTDTLSDLHFISSTIGMIAGDSGRVFKTSNGGSSWNLLTTGVVNKLNGIFVESPSKSYACGNNGIVLYGTGGGTSWTNETISANDLFDITFALNTSAGWVVGETGTAAKRVNPENYACVGTNPTASVGYPFFTYYMDSRTSLLYLASEIAANGGGPGTITSVGFFFDSVSSQVMNGFMIKMQNTTKTTLTGYDSTGWTTVYNGTYLPSQGTGLQFIPLNTPFMYEAGKNLLIEICFNNSVYTVNSWVQASNAPGRTFHGHADLTSGNGCVDINTGSLFTPRPNMCFVSNFITNEGGKNSLLPDKFRLHQNYPNPFNPVTRINYDIPKNTFVSLKIYDMLGREVVVLVNESKNAGSYTVEFNASNLTSGVYFYRLETIGFSETKRMMLIK